MRKLVVSEFVSLDGVMQDPGGAEKTKHGGWSMPYWNDEIAQFKGEEFAASDALLLGRVTYQAFAVAWPASKDAGADTINHMRKYVVSTTLKTAEWNNSILIKDKVAEQLAHLKQQPGKNILVAGSGRLVQTLIQHDLIDEYRLLVYPVILGSGRRLFDIDQCVNLKLIQAQAYKSGVVGFIYERASENK